jgi:hypothetical protein
LMEGDAHGAIGFLNVSSQELEQIKFYLPDLAPLALSSKAAGHIAVARSHLNAGNFPLAEQSLGRARAVYDDLLGGLGPSNAKNAPGYAEIFGNRVEVSLLFMREDFAAMDVPALGHRLASVQDDAGKLEQLLGLLPSGSITKMLKSYVVLVSVYATLHRTLEALLIHRRPLKRQEVEALISAGDRIRDTRQLAQSAGDRGKMAAYALDLLARQQRNLLEWGRSATRDFGRFSGPIALGALVVLLFVVHLIVRPEGVVALLYFLGCLIAALITGFGYNALRFRPLIKLFSEALAAPAGTSEDAADST